jgi:SAM-dependent methyltransferase
MLELLDPKDIDPVAYDKGYLSQIREYSLLPGKRIGWNYCMDYTWLAMRVEGLWRRGMRVVDVGCGPGAIHGYLEDEHDIDIVGIDMNRWEKDYVDIVGDFTDDELRRKYGFGPDSLDLIVSVSAFEHNTVENHKRLVEVCLQCLKPGGRLIATFSVAPGRTRQSRNQWDLSKWAIEEIYGERFKTFDYWGVWRRWRKHKEIPLNYKNRYGKWRLWDPRFLSVGADILKQ